LQMLGNISASFKAFRRSTTTLACEPSDKSLQAISGNV
jgi:hypothetical protein